jgi:hypothetical protein
MSWTAELLHLFRRDLRRTIWPLLSYVATLLLAVATATEVLGTAQGMLLAVGQVVVFLAPLLVALTVLADSTIRVDAFWAVQPIRTSVVIASKLLFVLLLLAMCAAAILVALSAWQLRVVPPDAVSGAAFANFALLLLGTAIIATACTSLTAVGLLLVVMFALALVIGLSVATAQLELTRTVWATTSSLMAVGGTMLFALAYRQPRWSAARRGTMLISGIGVMLVPVLTLGEQTKGRTVERIGTVTEHVALRMPLDRQPECARNRVIVPVEITSPPTWRVELMRPSVVLTLVDGTKVSLSSERWMASSGIWGPMIPGALSSIEGVSDAGSMATRVRRSDIAFELSRDRSIRICGRVANATLLVQMRASSAAELMRVDLGAGGNVSVPGYRAQIESAEVSDTSVAIDVRVSMLGSVMAGRRYDLASLDFALLHGDQRRLVRLYDYQDSDRANIGVLPGLRYMSNRLRLQRYRPDALRSLDLRAWRDSAVLLVIAPLWQTNGERVISATIAGASGSTTDSR